MATAKKAVEKAVVVAESALKKLEKEALSLVDKVKSLVVIKDAEHYQRADALWKQLKDMMKVVDATFDPITKAAYNTWQISLAQKKKSYQPLDQAARSVKGIMEAWDRKQQQLAIKATEDLQVTLQEELGVSADSGVLPPVQIKKDVPRTVGGAVFTTLWDAEVTDLMLLCQAVVCGEAPLDCIEGNQVYLRSKAKLEKEKMNVPGVRAWSRRV